MFKRMLYMDLQLKRCIHIYIYIYIYICSINKETVINTNAVIVPEIIIILLYLKQRRSPLQVNATFLNENIGNNIYKPNDPS